MSTAARPALAIRPAPATHWAPWAILAADVAGLEIAFLIGLLVRHLLAPWLSIAVGPPQYLGVAAGILLLPLVNYQIGLYPGYLLGPVERLRRRTLATLSVFGGLVAWDNLVARGVFSRGRLLATLLFALILPPLAEAATRWILIRRGHWGIPVLMLGAGSAGRALARTLMIEPQLGLKPVAFLDNRADTWNTAAEGIPVMGPLGLASDFERRAEVAIVCLPDLDRGDAALHRCDARE